MATMTPASGVPYTVPPEPSRLPSMLLAAVVHIGLLLFLWAGISWQNTEPVAVEAEVWDMQTKSAAAPPLPEPERVQPPEPKPVPPPPVPKVVTPPVEQPAPPKPPDIALEREKQRKELKQKQEQEKLLAEQKREQEQKDQEKKELAEQKARELAEKKAKEKAEKLAKAKQEAAEKKRVDDLRTAEIRRLTGATGTSGDAPKATAPRIDTGYLASITSKIKSTTSYLGSTNMPGNPRVVFKIEELPTGEIISVRMVKSSGVPGFDDAVEKGIMKSSPLPKKKDGTVERTLEIAFSMKDLN